MGQTEVCYLTVFSFRLLIKFSREFLPYYVMWQLLVGHREINSLENLLDNMKVVD